MAYSKLQTGDATFAEMMNGFGVVTVMNARIYDIPEVEEGKFLGFDKLSATQIRDYFKDEVTEVAFLDSLKVANVTVEGPNKTGTGGRYSNPLIKFGKSARLEMQDALGNAKAIEAFGGSLNQYEEEGLKTVTAMHVSEDFASEKLIIGESFFIDRKSGRQVKVDIMFYRVLPDSIFNLTQDAEGDATVFDMNADLLTTEILVPDSKGTSVVHGVFYSIIPFEEKTA